MMFSWILISLLVRFLKAEEIVVYAQIGGTAILPNKEFEIPNKESSLYVNWYRGLDSTNPIISKNPQSGIQKGKDVKTHASLSSDFSLQISPVQDFDFDVWSCEQHVLTSKFTRTYRLYHVTIPKVLPVMFGNSLSLECKLDNSPVRSSVTWIPPQNSDCPQNKNYPKTFYIKEVSRCHSGVWTCKVDYDRRVAEATTTVSVIDLSAPPPDPIYTSASSSSTVTLPCSLSLNIPWSVLNETGLRGGSWIFTPLSDQNQQKSLLNLSVGHVVRWDITADTDRRVQGRELKDQDLSLINLPVSEKIRGEYNCNLKINSKTLSSKVKVEVLQVSSSGGSRLYVGQRVNLTCTLGHPLAPELEVKWKCRSCSSLHSSPFLSIPEVTMEHSGQWTCELWKNETRLTYAVLSLKIEKAPVDIWLCVAISSGVVVFILLLVIAVIGIRRHKQTMMYRRRKTRFCCCKTPQAQGFYKT
ncbi:CD4-1 molecule [Pimephales promelas]|uniref:CD4-1 molecule n=1 Tax=Pimephales promelas TaxID=90988 RepID=UPI001955BC24|nr:CD4-1 molecule [Pimephales promelas]